MYIAKTDLKTSIPEWVAHISFDLDFEIYIAGIDLKTSISDWLAHISDDVILNYVLQEWISKLQFRNGLTISHLKPDFEKHIIKIDLKMHFRNRLPISHDVDFEIKIARIDLKTSIPD